MKIPFRFSKRRIVVIVAVVAVVAVLLTGVYVWESTRIDNGSVPDVTDSDGLSEIIVDGQRYHLNDQVESVLLLGIDKFNDDTWGNHVNNQQADAIMLAVFNHEEQTYTVLQINRDTMTQIETLGITGESGGVITAQLALAHAYGTGKNDSARNVLHAVSDLLYGVDIPHYISIKMDAIPILNDSVGGVQVELLDDFTALDASFEKGATVTLRGEQALAYIRARDTMEEPTNISRMNRQRQYMTAWSDAYKLSRESDSTMTASMLKDVADYTITDMTVTTLEKFSAQVDSYSFKGIVAVEGESVVVDEHMEFYVDEVALQKQVLELFYHPTE